MYVFALSFKKQISNFLKYDFVLLFEKQFFNSTTHSYLPFAQKKKKKQNKAVRLNKQQRKKNVLLIQPVDKFVWKAIRTCRMSKQTRKKRWKH